jgi:hypothetical protein
MFHVEPHQRSVLRRPAISFFDFIFNICDHTQLKESLLC